MKLFMQLLGLPKPSSLNSSSQLELPIVQRFLLPVDANATFKDVWKQAEDFVEANYPEGLRDDWVIKKLTTQNGPGADEYDLNSQYTVASIFDSDTDPNTRIVRIHTRYVDRETSIPVGSHLHVRGTKRAARGLQEETVKRRRAERERYGMPIDYLSPDHAVPSGENDTLLTPTPASVCKDDDGFKIPPRPPAVQGPRSSVLSPSGVAKKAQLDPKPDSRSQKELTPSKQRPTRSAVVGCQSRISADKDMTAVSYDANVVSTPVSRQPEPSVNESINRSSLAEDHSQLQMRQTQTTAEAQAEQDTPSNNYLERVLQQSLRRPGSYAGRANAHGSSRDSLVATTTEDASNGSDERPVPPRRPALAALAPHRGTPTSTSPREATKDLHESTGSRRDETPRSGSPHSAATTQNTTPLASTPDKQPLTTSVDRSRKHQDSVSTQTSSSLSSKAIVKPVKDSRSVQNSTRSSSGAKSTSTIAAGRASPRWNDEETMKLRDALASGKNPPSIAKSNIIPGRTLEGIRSKAAHLKSQEANRFRADSAPDLAAERPSTQATSPKPATRRPPASSSDQPVTSDDPNFLSQSTTGSATSVLETVPVLSEEDTGNLKGAILKQLTIPEIQKRFLPKHALEEVLNKVCQVKEELRNEKARSRIDEYRAERIRQEEEQGLRSTTNLEHFTTHEVDLLLAARIDGIDLEWIANKYFPRRDADQIKSRAQDLWLVAKKNAIENRKKSGASQGEVVRIQNAVTQRLAPQKQKVIAAMGSAVRGRIEARLQQIQRVDRKELDVQRSLILEEEECAKKDKEKDQRDVRELRSAQQKSACVVDGGRPGVRGEQASQRTFDARHTMRHYDAKCITGGHELATAVADGGPVAPELAISPAPSLATEIASNHRSNLFSALQSLERAGNSVGRVPQSQTLEASHTPFQNSSSSGQRRQKNQSDGQSVQTARPVATKSHEFNLDSSQSALSQTQDLSPTLSKSVRIRNESGDTTLHTSTAIDHVSSSTINEGNASHERTRQTFLNFPRLKGKQPAYQSELRTPERTDGISTMEKTRSSEVLVAATNEGVTALGSPFRTSPQRPQTSPAAHQDPGSSRRDPSGSSQKSVDEAAAQLYREADAARSTPSGESPQERRVALATKSRSLTEDGQAYINISDQSSIDEDDESESSEDSVVKGGENEIQVLSSQQPSRFVEDLAYREAVAREQQDARARSRWKKLSSKATPARQEIATGNAKGQRMLASPVRSQSHHNSQTDLNRAPEDEESADEEIVRFPHGLISPRKTSPLPNAPSLSPPQSSAKSSRPNSAAKSRDQHSPRIATQSSLGSLRPPFPSSGKVRSATATQTSPQKHNGLDVDIGGLGADHCSRARSRSKPAEKAVLSASFDVEPTQNRMGTEKPQKRGREQHVVEELNIEHRQNVQVPQSSPTPQTTGRKRAAGAVANQDNSQEQDNLLKRRKVDSRTLPAQPSGKTSAKKGRSAQVGVSASQPAQSTTAFHSRISQVNRSSGKQTGKIQEIFSDPIKARPLNSPKAKKPASGNFANHEWNKLAAGTRLWAEKQQAEHQRKELEAKAKLHADRKFMRKHGLEVSPHASDSAISESSESSSDSSSDGE
ncbi:hypothetical protein K461DRAFT_309294 [Myriangium duriaei CBS 260.36]|uniref:Uncharacterized protein n=1 Tax=Myriangium duriaei CBS 260.36 TaxID=1168546 RepID=A0A9P4MPD3_9PEZI|nr:hypothetical protein K461DRAFT_309294 [Myriangium duriaei CBS 260.36]